jgi:hypothetical protein
MLGTCDRKRGSIPLGGTVKWFQFPGAWSKYNIGQVGWQSHLSTPGYIKLGESSWTDVSFAYSTDGPHAFLDHTVLWGGDDYENVDASYYRKHVYFYPTPSTTIDPDTLLWAPCILLISAYPPGSGTTVPAPGTYGFHLNEWVTVEADPDSDYDFQYWLLDGYEVYNNPITITMVCDRTLVAYFMPEGGGGGGGCPYVYTWNGQRYVMDNNLLPASEITTGDVEDYYRLEQLLAPTYQGTRRSVYSLQIREFENEHDYFDKVKLLAVDHSSNVNVAVTPYGEILTYSNPAPPISAVDDNNIDVLSLLSSVDENYYQGYNGSYVTITFASTDVSNGIKLVIREDFPGGVLLQQ